MNEDKIIKNHIQATHDYIETTVEWLKTFPTDKLLEEYTNIDALLECNAIYDSVLFDLIDPILDAIRDEFVIRLKIVTLEKGAQ